MGYSKGVSTYLAFNVRCTLYTFALKGTKGLPGRTGLPGEQVSNNAATSCLHTLVGNFYYWLVYI